MTNFCKSGPLSSCEVKTSIKDQKKCRHYKKATNYNRCMFLIFEDYCDSVEAQNDRDGKLSNEKIVEIEQSKLE